MHVTDYELFAVPPRWLFLKLETSDGTVGWGEPILEGRTRTLHAAVCELVDDFILGEDPTDIERHWQRCYRGGHYRGGPVLMSAIAGIDQALWDIKGKQLGAPVHELLGGRVRDKVKTYQWVGGDHPDEVVADAERARDDGYSVVKMMLGSSYKQSQKELIRMARERVAAVWDTVGDSVDIAIDCRGRINKANIPRLASALDEYEVLFLEEPVLPEQNESLNNLTPQIGIPVATGQRMYSRADFKQVLGNDSVQFVQPDISHAGGITEVKKIGTLADTYDVSLIPKSPVGPISLASALQVTFSTPNAVIQEQGLDVHNKSNNDLFKYVTDPSVFEYEDGFLYPLDDPGLGITVDESYVREQAEKTVRWKTPLYYNEDGSVAEW